MRTVTFEIGQTASYKRFTRNIQRYGKIIRLYVRLHSK